MRVLKESPVEVAVPRIDLGTGDVVAAVIIKSTFDIDDAGRLAPSAQPMPLVKQFLETPFGIFHGEVFFKKQGVDLCVLGTVRRSRPVVEARVRMTCRQRRWELVVSGDRRWVRGRGNDPRLPPPLVPSRALPFTSMPLGYQQAFGGAAAIEELKHPYAANPEGIGYYRTLAQADNQPLCNIEDARRPPAQVWRAQDDARPEPPAGWGPYPNFWALRASAAVDIDQKTGALRGVSPSLFNHAHPDLILDAVGAGDDIVIDGMLDQTLHVRVPPCPAAVEVVIAGQRAEVDAPIDGLFLWVDQRKLVVTQRGRFRYARRPAELRAVHVRAAAIT